MAPRMDTDQPLSLIDACHLLHQPHHHLTIIATSIFDFKVLVITFTIVFFLFYLSFQKYAWFKFFLLIVSLMVKCKSNFFQIDIQLDGKNVCLMLMIYPKHLLNAAVIVYWNCLILYELTKNRDWTPVSYFLHQLWSFSIYALTKFTFSFVNCNIIKFAIRINCAVN